VDIETKIAEVTQLKKTLSEVCVKTKDESDSNVAPLAPTIPVVKKNVSFKNLDASSNVISSPSSKPSLSSNPSISSNKIQIMKSYASVLADSAKESTPFLLVKKSKKNVESKKFEISYGNSNTSHFRQTLPAPKPKFYQFFLGRMPNEFSENDVRHFLEKDQKIEIVDMSILRTKSTSTRSFRIKVLWEFKEKINNPSIWDSHLIFRDFEYVDSPKARS
jgi:hypothetical protein